MQGSSNPYQSGFAQPPAPTNPPWTAPPAGAGYPPLPVAPRRNNFGLLASIVWMIGEVLLGVGGVLAGLAVGTFIAYLQGGLGDSSYATVFGGFETALIVAGVGVIIFAFGYPLNALKDR